MDVSDKYPLLVGHSLTGTTNLRGLQEVADFICTHGLYGDLMITTSDGQPFISTFGIYIDRIADMEYREQLLKVLIPMQMELDGTAEIYETDGEITNEIEMEM